MSRVNPLAIASPRTAINLIEQASSDSKSQGLMEQRRFLAALYFFGYSIEMVLSAAYYRIDRFSLRTCPSTGICDSGGWRTRGSYRASNGQPLMESDPYSLVGWARFLEWQRSASRN